MDYQESDMEEALKKAVTNQQLDSLYQLFKEHEESLDEIYYDPTERCGSLASYMLLSLFELALETSSKAIIQAIGTKIYQQEIAYDRRSSVGGYCLVHLYAYKQNKNALEHLLAVGYDINAYFDHDIENLEHSGSLLTEAIRGGQNDEVIGFIINNPKFNETSSGYCASPDVEDSFYDEREIKIEPFDALFDTPYRQRLVEMGASLALYNYRGDRFHSDTTLLAKALLAINEVGDIDLDRVKLLLQHGASSSIYIENDTPPLELVTYTSKVTEHFLKEVQVPLIQLLIGYGADLNYNDDNYYEGLIRCGREDLARCLLGLKSVEQLARLGNEPAESRIFNENSDLLA